MRKDHRRSHGLKGPPSQLGHHTAPPGPWPLHPAQSSAPSDTQQVMLPASQCVGKGPCS